MIEADLCGDEFGYYVCYFGSVCLQMSLVAEDVGFDSLEQTGGDLVDRLEKELLNCCFCESAADSFVLRKVEIGNIVNETRRCEEVL